jgi:hypothetical protein
MFWIVIGSFVYDVPMPVLPFSTEGCAADDSTVSYVFNAFTTSISDLSNVIPVTVTTTLAPWIEWYYPSHCSSVADFFLYKDFLLTFV